MYFFHFCCFSFSGEGSPYLDLNTQTGNVTLTSKFADLTEDTALVLTAVATDHGQPPLSTTGQSNGSWHHRLFELFNCKP